MTLCLAQSLVDNGGVFVAQDQLRKYLAWLNHGYLSAVNRCFGLGKTTRASLKLWEKFFKANPKIDPRDPTAHVPGQEAIDRKLKHEVRRWADVNPWPTDAHIQQGSRGNGSLMRVAPIGLVYHHSMDEACRYAALSSEVTHPYPTNGEACQLYTRLIVRSLRGACKSDLVSEVAEFSFVDLDLHARFSKYSSTEIWMDQDERAISSSGWVVDTLEAALWAFFTTPSFREGAVRVVNLGDDADTVGAVYGGLAGAHYGLDAIPTEWRQGVQKSELVQHIAAKLVDVCGDKTK